MTKDDFIPDNLSRSVGFWLACEERKRIAEACKKDFPLPEYTELEGELRKRCANLLLATYETGAIKNRTMDERYCVFDQGVWQYCDSDVGFAGEFAVEKVAIVLWAFQELDSFPEIAPRRFTHPITDQLIQKLLKGELPSFDRHELRSSTELKRYLEYCRTWLIKGCKEHPRPPVPPDDIEVRIADDFVWEEMEGGWDKEGRHSLFDFYVDSDQETAIVHMLEFRVHTLEWLLGIPPGEGWHTHF